MTENNEMILLCKERVESFKDGETRDCNSNLFEVILVDRETIRLKCAHCGNAKTFRVVECLNEVGMDAGDSDSPVPR